MSDLIERSYRAMGFFVRTKRFINQQRLRPQESVQSGSYPEFLKKVKEFGVLMNLHKDLVEKMHTDKSLDLEQSALKSLWVILKKRDEIISLGIIKE
jgi:hypothetical protein